MDKITIKKINKSIVEELKLNIRSALRDWCYSIHESTNKSLDKSLTTLEITVDVFSDYALDECREEIKKIVSQLQDNYNTINIK